MVKIKIDHAKCDGTDKLCSEICPVLVFGNNKFAKPKVVSAKNCILCRMCQVNCQNQAIEFSV